jgi:hypothetical protein
MKKLLEILEFWAKKPKFDDFFKYVYRLTVEENVKFTECMQDNTLEQFQELYRKWDGFEPKKDLVGLLDKKGRLLLQGFRQTVGTVVEEPPSIDVLVSSFEKQWHENDQLTVGARALSKHVHRSRNGWYELHDKDFVGPSVRKNQIAKELLQRMIENSIWFNVHSLPHNVVVFEIRVREGFGCRWDLEGEFRGFLEPMMKIYFHVEREGNSLSTYDGNIPQIGIKR